MKLTTVRVSSAGSGDVSVGVEDSTKDPGRHERGSDDGILKTSEYGPEEHLGEDLEGVGMRSLLVGS
jgi:hypothetical protein